MSVGHVARLAEAAGVPTVVISIGAFAETLEAMSVPRLLLTPHLMGRPLGPPGDKARHRETLLAALLLLEGAVRGGTVRKLPGGYRG